MNVHQSNVSNYAVYRRMKEGTDAYPRGWFVAIVEEQIVAAAADFHELESQLRGQGEDPRDVLAVEAGADYPEYVTIYGGDDAAFWIRKLEPTAP
jgi:hypothetical protein